MGKKQKARGEERFIPRQRGQRPRYAPKGPTQISPGQRPGKTRENDQTQSPEWALQPIHIEIPTYSFRVCAALSGLGTGRRLFPRALPWADLFRPLRGRDW